MVRLKGIIQVGQQVFLLMVQLLLLVHIEIMEMVRRVDMYVYINFQTGSGVK